jgi:putative protein-disulfide isomerase
MSERVLWYFADPMCSWCWGFSPVIEELRAKYSERLDFKLIMGGLRAGMREPLSDTLRDEILHHWYEVRRRTGQHFRFQDAMPAGFVYDSEPACRAVVTVQEMAPGRGFVALEALHVAFYLKGRDITQRATLVAVATELGLDGEDFARGFDSDETKQLTQHHFATALRFSVRAFPTVVLQQASQQVVLTQGYQPFDRLAPALDDWLA